LQSVGFVRYNLKGEMKYNVLFLQGIIEGLKNCNFLLLITIAFRGNEETD